MMNQLYVDTFNEAAQHSLGGFCCGPEPWAREATAWLKGSDSIESMESRKTEVWLYYTEGDELVGFGSLGTTRRRWPPPQGTHENLLILPMLGIDFRFRGKPQDSESRFSNQIMRDLIAKARERNRSWASSRRRRR